jgi:hypothetical protein
MSIVSGLKWRTSERRAGVGFEAKQVTVHHDRRETAKPVAAKPLCCVI